ncbi:MAG: oxidative damage protection protein [Pseudomonadota bacterium]
MTLIFCRKYKKNLEALERAPFPGVKGEDILQNISRQAWQEWLEHQTRLINEKHLQLFDSKAQKFLSEQRERFFNNEQFEAAEGFVPAANNPTL